MRAAPRVAPSPAFRPREGVALPAVLWVIAALGTAATIGLAAVRDGSATSQYRIDAIRARWLADGCLALWRARLDEDLRTGDDAAWLQGAAPDGSDAGCVITVAPPEDGPIDLNQAPESTLYALPGFDEEVVSRVLELRTLGRRIHDWADLTSGLSPPARERIERRSGGRPVMFDPPAWSVTGSARLGRRTVPAVVERWVRAGNRVAVSRREVL